MTNSIPCPFPECGGELKARNHPDICWLDCLTCEFSTPVRPTAEAALEAAKRVRVLPEGFEPSKQCASCGIVTTERPSWWTDPKWNYCIDWRSEEAMKLGKFMVAEPIVMSPREVYEIRDSRAERHIGITGGANLGHVEWYPRWKQYVFEPERGAVFSHDCLAELSAFCKRVSHPESEHEYVPGDRGCAECGEGICHYMHRAEEGGGQ